MSFHLKQSTTVTAKAKSQPGEQMGLADRPEIRRSSCPSCSSLVTLAIQRLAQTCSQAHIPFTSSLQLHRLSSDTPDVWQIDKGPGGDRRIYSVHWLCLTVT